MKNILLILIFVSPINLFAQSDQIKDRLNVLENFVDDLKEGSVSNEDIMRKYVAEGNYFKYDSIREGANMYINHVLRDIVHEDIDIVKYSDYEVDFKVEDNPPGRPLSPRTKQKLNFILFTIQQREVPVDINDLYVLKRNNSKNEGMFILFDDQDKILSFSAMQKDSNVVLLQF